MGGISIAMMVVAMCCSNFFDRGGNAGNFFARESYLEPKRLQLMDRKQIIRLITTLEERT